MQVTALKNDAGSIGLVALDEAYLLADSIGLSIKEPSHEELLNDVLSELLNLFRQQASGLVLDPVYSLPLLKEDEQNAPLIVRLEQLQNPDPLAVPQLLKNWGVEDISNMYGMAKLELHYHPAEEQALTKKQFVAEIFDFCEHEEIDLLLKLMIYNPTEEKFDIPKFQESQMEAVSELQRFASILALQYPQDPLAAATLTTNLDIPWLLTADDTPYDRFKENLRVALENGATGFLASETLWQEIEGMRHSDQSPDIEKILQFIQTTSKDRIIELLRISKEELADQ